VPAALRPGMRPGIHCVVGVVGPRTDLHVRGKFRRTGIRSPDCPGPGIESLYLLSYPDVQEEKTHANLACLKMRHRHKTQSQNPK